jgi:outer membrane protein assembly factor BamC
MIRFVIVAATALVLGACSLDDVNRDKKLAYRSSKPAKSLTFPPELNTDQIENRFQLPNTLSSYNKGKDSPTAAGQQILPKFSDIRLVRVGRDRWIETKTRPEILWPRIKEFWKKNGLDVVKERPSSGMMETDWAENRAHISDGAIRDFLSRALGTLYSTGFRDKFRLRLEINAQNNTEIFLSHQRMAEKLSGEDTRWVPGEPDPEVEAEILARLMAYLGASKAEQAKAKSSRAQTYERARLVIDNNGSSYLTVLDDFPNAWRRVGNALNRTGFAVEDLNRSAGVYYVNYSDPVKDSDTGFFARVFGSSSKVAAKKYQVRVVQAGNNVSVVEVLDSNRNQLVSNTAKRITNILYQQLK